MGNTTPPWDKSKQGEYIPDPRPRSEEYIPKSLEESKYTHEFQSLTDIFQPKDQYTRTVIQAATGNTVLDEHVERLKRMIEARGEYVYLAKVKLDGDHCSCYNPISKEVRRKYCRECFGTRISGGYSLFYNQDSSDGKIIIAAPFADETIKWEEWGRDWKEEKEYWTGPGVPLQRSRNVQAYDFVVRYNADGTELGRYYITDSKPSFSVGNQVTHQKFAIRLADRPASDDNGHTAYRGDIIYEVPILELARINGHMFTMA